jgi:preprotein translocase subunit Sec63
MIIVIPVVVGLWWRNSSKFLEDGVMQNTAYRFYRQVQENTATKYIPGILSSAVELCEAAPCKNATAQELSKLHSRVSPHFVKNQARAACNAEPFTQRAAAIPPFATSRLCRGWHCDCLRIEQRSRWKAP